MGWHITLTVPVSCNLKAYFRKTGYFLYTLPKGTLRREISKFNLYPAHTYFSSKFHRTYLALRCDALFKERVLYALRLDLQIFIEQRIDISSKIRFLEIKLIHQLFVNVHHNLLVKGNLTVICFAEPGYLFVIFSRALSVTILFNMN